MKKSTLLSILVLISMVLVAVPAPMAAQEPAATPQRAVDNSPRPAAVPTAPLPGAPEIGAWEYGPATPFQWTRFDAAFVPGPEGQAWANKVYFLGGRTGGAPAHDLNIWSFDPTTGTYADTGVDMLVNISNYTANVIMDDGTGNGPAIYIIGGYDADAAANHGDVQRFYPQTGTVEVLPDCDDWTVQVAGATVGAMGNAVVDDVIYVFGGWESTAAPYFNASTWAFDPNAASCSRWTNLSTDLTPPRAYIQTAAQDGKVYAMGGIDVYTGSELDPTAVVEVLDTANLAAGWQAVASMPVAGAEGRGFGFDADTLGARQPAGRIYVAGTADWSAGSAEAMEYQVGLDFWDQAFPDLNEDRRDHAGVYIPIETSTEGDGLPGMWVFGGRWDNGDAPPFAPTEFYEFPVLSCDILLVDDDWDFDQTVVNDGGRPYYTSTLEYLGLPYSLWDTVSQGAPTATDMDPYDVVIWFTGYDWVDPISPTVEAPELMTYLNNGGNLLMSSMEQEYAYPGSTIMSDYFWVASVTEDVVLTGTVGSPSDPLFSALGPYAMGRPDAWAAYWPTGQYEGPYDDEVSVKAGGLEPMIYTDSSNPNSTRFQGASFKTIYLGFPFEWVTDVGDRAEFVQTAVNWFCAGGGGAFELIPPGQTGGGIAGATVPYTMTIFNDLGYAETFDISYTSVWPINGPAQVGPVADGDTLDFVVEVTVPNDGSCYESDIATLLAETQTGQLFTDTAVIETSVVPDGVGVVDGHVYDANTFLAIENAYVYLELGDTEFEAHTDANGYYNIADVPGCTFAGQYEAVGYFGQSQVPVSVTGGVTTTQDISLDASVPALSESTVSVDVAVDSTGTYNLTLDNNGTGGLVFHVSEVANDSIYPIPEGQAAMPSGIDPQVYADLSAAADGSGKFVVYLAEQADLSAAFGIQDRSARGHYVLNALRATAERSQATLRADLDRAGTPYEARYIVNALVVEGDITLAENLITRADVAYIGPNAKIEAPEPVEMSPAAESPDALAWGIEKVRADDVWSDFGAFGAGIVIANIDTGVDYNHPALEQQYRGTLGGGSYDHNYAWWDPYGYGPLVPYDWHNHGSHTMGTMLGSDNPADPMAATEAIGMAPQGTWFACQGFDQNTGYGYNAELLECAEFLLAPWDLTGANPDPDLRADVINNSWGGGQAQWWYNQAIYAWRAAGIIGIFSAGNEGPACETMGDPGDMANMLAVGATGSTDAIASFSSRGPASVTGLTKPNVSAPGVNIYSAYRDGTYGLMGGTSMAAPHVSGEAALLWSAVPELRGDVQLTYWIIEQSALGLTTNEGCGGDSTTDIPNNTFGWGRIDAYEAVSLALSSAWDIDWLDVNPVSGEVMPSGSTDIELTLDATGLTLGECYTGTLKFEYNDPYIIEQFVPVEMCVVEAGPAFSIYLPIIVKND